MRIAIVANTSWNLYNFRLNLMRSLMAAGHEVVAVGPPDHYAEKLIAAGIHHRVIPLARASINPFRELRSVWALHQVLREERVDLVLSYTPKGNVYSAMASAVCGLRTVPNVSGLGRVFIRQTPLTWLVKLLYRFAFGRAERVFFQNQTDFDLFTSMGLVKAGKAERIPGSGVDLERFSPFNQTPACQLSGLAHHAGENGSDDQKKFVFLMVSRLLWDKGVGEFVEAARIVKEKNSLVEFRLLGYMDMHNPSSIPRSQVEAWVAGGDIHYLGATDDVLPHLKEADCVVLPSYREGVPRTLLEAAAMAKPVIATDVPGCRDTLDDGVTGYLCRVKDAHDLSNKMARMVEMNRGQLDAMGLRGREKMQREFDEELVIDRYLKFLDKLETERGKPSPVKVPQPDAF